MENNEIEVLEGASLSSNQQFLTFLVNKSIYAVNIMNVMEIRGWCETTRIPNSAIYKRGVINLRGFIIPIFDLKARFVGELTKANEKNVVIVMSVRDKTIGILVDAVSDILTVEADEIKTDPHHSNEKEVDAFVDGLISHDGKMVITLDISKIFAEITREENALSDVK